MSIAGWALRSFLERSAILIFERRHEQVCVGQCTYD